MFTDYELSEQCRKERGGRSDEEEGAMTRKERRGGRSDEEEGAMKRKERRRGRSDDKTRRKMTVTWVT